MFMLTFYIPFLWIKKKTFSLVGKPTKCKSTITQHETWQFT